MGFVAAMALVGLLPAVGCSRAPTSPDDGGLVGSPARDGLSRGNLWYKLALDDDRLDLALRLFAPPARARFFLPGEWAGRADYADVIGIAGASTPAGPVDFAIDRKAGAVDVESAEAPWIQLEYRVELTDRSPFHAQTEEGVLVAFGPTFVISPAQQILERTRDIPIELDLPASYEVLATWPSHGAAPSAANPERRVHRFVAADGYELRDAFVVAGPTLRKVRTGSGATLVEVAFSPAFEGDTAELAELVAAVTERYRDRFGNAGGVRAYVRTKRSAPGEFGGIGRRGGFILDVAPDTSVSDATRLLVAHEALHPWNGHLLLAAPIAEERTRWFKEGVTHYLALRSVPELDESFVLDELARIASNYARNPVTRGAQAQPIDRARHPYDFGALVALAIDAQLVRQSAGTTDVGCWLSKLLEHPEQRYDEETLLAALRACAGPDVGRTIAQIWRRSVRERQPIDLRALFAGVGLHWLPETSQREARLVPLDEPRPLYRRLFSLDAP